MYQKALLDFLSFRASPLEPDPSFILIFAAEYEDNIPAVDTQTNWKFLSQPRFSFPFDKNWKLIRRQDTVYHMTNKHKQKQ